MPSQPRLKSQEDCRRALARAYADLKADIIKPDKARVLAYIALSCSSILKEHDLEMRIQRLETLPHRRGFLRKDPA
jgi:hypothetical protein